MQPLSQITMLCVVYTVIENRLRDTHNVLLNVIRNIMRCEGSDICGRGATEICAKCYRVPL